MKKILFAAGGTGGHLFPAEELAELLAKDCEVVFAGHKLGESPYFKKRFRFFDVQSAPFGVFFLFTLVPAFFKALLLLLREKPKVVVGFGSYHTVPLLLASVFLRKKIILYEPNRSLGKVIKLFAPFSKAIAAPYLTGNKIVKIPPFPWILKPKPEKAEALRYYGLEPTVPTALIFGGSQGAKFLNEAIPRCIKNMQVLHFSGNGADCESIRLAYQDAGVRAVVKPFESDMQIAYGAVDVAICRSGAGTISELIHYEVPSLLIPYPFAYGHQQHNAKYLEQAGGAKMLLQESASTEAIFKELSSLNLDAMRVALRSIKRQNEGLMSFEELVRGC